MFGMCWGWNKIGGPKDGRLLYQLGPILNGSVRRNILLPLWILWSSTKTTFAPKTPERMVSGSAFWTFRRFAQFLVHPPAIHFLKRDLKWKLKCHQDRLTGFFYRYQKVFWPNWLFESDDLEVWHFKWPVDIFQNDQSCFEWSRA